MACRQVRNETETNIETVWEKGGRYTEKKFILKIQLKKVKKKIKFLKYVFGI